MKRWRTCPEKTGKGFEGRERKRPQSSSACGTNLVRPYVVEVQVGVAGGRVDAVLLKVFTDVVRGGLRQQPVNTLPGEEIGDAWGGSELPEAERVPTTSTSASLMEGVNYLSAKISRGFRPWAHPLTIQAVSKAARKPRAQPVPIGQKGCEQETQNKQSQT